MTAQQETSSADVVLTALLSGIDHEIAEELRREQRVTDDSGSAQTLTEIGRHICFTLAGQHLAVPLSLVIEVGELETVRPLPFLPSWSEGVTNLRGEIVSVTNLAVLFKIIEKVPRKGRTVIILHEKGMKTAAIVDKITGTRLLYRKEGMKHLDAAAVPVDFISGSALFLAENGEHELELFDGSKLLSSIRLQ
ncbi:chemotaxis protein CheW [Desulfobulbus sp. F5]|nr:chemotaxis protein CheW [Desulfobulbus sp. F5]